jgi:hypothetical protein
MTNLLPDRGLSAAQRAFMETVVRLGATAPAAAKPLTGLPRLSPGDLAALVDLGYLREAAAQTYYAYTPESTPHGVYPRRGGRWITALLFILLLLVPVIYVQLVHG